MPLYFCILLLVIKMNLKQFYVIFQKLHQIPLNINETRIIRNLGSHVCLHNEVGVLSFLCNTLTTKATKRLHLRQVLKNTFAERKHLLNIFQMKSIL